MSLHARLLIVALLVAGGGCWNNESAVGGTPSTNKIEAAQAQVRCPNCHNAAEAMPRLLGPVTPEGWSLHLAGKAVADGSCIGSKTVFVCRRCYTYSEDGIQSWLALPSRFGSQRPICYVIKYEVPQSLIDEKVTLNEAKEYRGQARLHALLVRAGIQFPPGACGSDVYPYASGLAVRAPPETHAAIRAYLTREFAGDWRSSDQLKLEDQNGQQGEP